MSKSTRLGVPPSRRADVSVALPLRVLLVHERTGDAAEIIRRLSGLEHPACEVTHIAAAVDSLEAIGEDEHDILLLGATPRLPSSTAVVRRLRDRAPNLPIVVVTTAEDDAFCDEMLAQGVQDCLSLAAMDKATLRRVLRYAAGHKHIQEEITRLKTFDALTGLPNRDLLRDHLRDAIVQSDAGKGLVGVLMMNLDRFKLVNETLGANRGDRLLQEVAHRLAACLPASCILARHNGDEFVVLATGLAAAQDATLVAQRMLNALTRPVTIEGHEVYVTGSIGICIYPGDGEDGEVLISNADAAVTRAKDLGRNHFQFYTMDMNAKTTRQLSLESELRRALDRGEFVVHYQPQFDLANRRVIGLEALIRWQHPELGLVPPNDFIPLAEETGLIAPIGEWVLGAASAQAKLWHADGHHDLRVAVNLSARQFFQENVLDSVTRILDRTHLPPGCLELELTESAVMQNPEEATATLCLLSNMGIRIAIDDFGTGHSSLNHLKRFPIDCLKIDRSFISDVTVNTEDAAIVQAIIAMAHSLRLEVVAEGVETIEQLSFLESHGCDMIQGYLVSRPLTADQITRTFLPQSGRRPDVLPFGIAAAGGKASRG